MLRRLRRITIRGDGINHGRLTWARILTRRASSSSSSSAARDPSHLQHESTTRREQPATHSYIGGDGTPSSTSSSPSSPLPPSPSSSFHLTRVSDFFSSSFHSVGRRLASATAPTVDAILRNHILTNLPKSIPIREDRRSAKVRIEKGRVCQEEIEQVATRMRRSRIHMKRYFEKAFPDRPTVDDDIPPDDHTASDSTLPVVGLCCSGGGYRAMLSTMGSLTAMQQQGLFDSAAYIAGLSGSTWAMAQIYANEKHIQERIKEITIVQQQYQQHQQQYAHHPHHTPSSYSQLHPVTNSTNHLFNPLLHSPVDLKRLSEELMMKVSSNLFTGVPIEFIKSCLVDRWSLFEAEVNNKAQHDQTTSADTLPPGRIEEIRNIAGQIVERLARTESDTINNNTTTNNNSTAATTGVPADTTSSPPLTLASFATLLQSVGLSDSFGWCLSHKLLNNETSSPPFRHPRLSDQISLLSHHSLPYPIYTAITFEGVQWEFTPHETGLPEFGAFVPSWSFGRNFHAGEMIPHPSERTKDDDTGGVLAQNELAFGLLLSCFASAFPTRIGRILEEVIYNNTNTSSEPILKYIHKFIHQRLKVGDESAFQPAKFPNFLKGIDQRPDIFPNIDHIPSSLLSTPLLSVMDAGLQCNLPLTSLLRPERGIDVILAFDQSSPPEANACDALRIGEEEARRLGLPCPDMTKSRQPLAADYKQIEMNQGDNEDRRITKSTPYTPSRRTSEELYSSLVRASNALVSVFDGDVRRGIPTIIYFPLIANPALHMRSNESPIGRGPPNAATPASSSSSSSGSSPSTGSILSSSSFPSPPFVSPSLAFDPRANFLAGGFCATLNFEYSLEESELLMGLTYTNCQQASQIIRKVLEDVRQQKRKIAEERRTMGHDHNANFTKTDPNITTVMKP